MKTGKSSIFLIELILVILFFSIASGVCVKLFIKAHQLDKRTNEITNCSVIAQNLAEAFYATNGDQASLQVLFEETNCKDIPSDNSFATNSFSPVIIQYISSDFDCIMTEALQQDNASPPYDYIAVLSIDSSAQSSSAGIMRKAQISITDHNQNEIYHLDLQKYIPLQGGVD